MRKFDEIVDAVHAGDDAVTVEEIEAFHVLWIMTEIFYDGKQVFEVNLIAGEDNLYEVIFYDGTTVHLYGSEYLSVFPLE